MPGSIGDGLAAVSPNPSPLVLGRSCRGVVDVRDLSVEGAGVEEFAPADLRAVNVGDVEDLERFGSS
jgi:hypothetical protein